MGALANAISLRSGRSGAAADAPYGVIFDKQKAIVGAPHGRKIPMSASVEKRVREIGDAHGYWYEGDGGDKKFFPAKYNGSWDDKMAKGIDAYPPEFLSAMFGAADMRKQVRMVEGPQRTIFDGLMANREKLSPLDGRPFSARTLSSYLASISDGDTDFTAMAKQPATRQNTEKFFKTGAAKTFPSNWEKFPHKAGKVMKKFLDTRDRFLIDQKRGVYVVGSGHLVNILKLDPSLEMLGGKKAG